MHVSFEAVKVSYNEAIGGDIVQVVFDSDISNESIEITKPYFLASVNFEFPPVSATTEWHDGNDFDGGAEIARVEMDMRKLCIWLDNGMTFEVSFKIDDQKYRQISSFFDTVVGQR